jgi:hypothetical protein
MLILIASRSGAKRFYLPGDAKHLPWYYACKFELDMQKVRDLTNNNQSKFGSMAKELSKIGNSIRIDLLAGMASSGIRELIRKNEERQDQMDAFQYAMGILTNENKPSTLVELMDSLKKSMVDEYLVKKSKALPRPTKCVKASKVNRNVNKIIYHHIRSNC